MKTIQIRVDKKYLYIAEKANQLEKNKEYLYGSILALNSYFKTKINVRYFANDTLNIYKLLPPFPDCLFKKEILIGSTEECNFYSIRETDKDPILTVQIKEEYYNESYR